MDLFQASILALIQGVTEFLPISSSAHLILAAHFFGLGEGFLAFDIAVHSGTLAAVVFHFRKELINMQPNHSSKITLSVDQNIWLTLIVASLPVFIAGALLRDLVATELRSTEVIAMATIIFAFVLWFADARRNMATAQTINLKQAFIIGLAQTLALIPGTSRAGITIAAALLLSLSRRQSLNFSFLLAIPVIAAASALNIWEIFNGSTINAELWYPMAVGFVISAVFALLTIKLFIRFVEKIGLLPFVIYRILLGIILLLFMTN